MNFLRWPSFVVLCIVMPTWSFADWWKRSGDRKQKIVFLNWFYLGISIVGFVATLLLTRNDIALVQSPADYPWSRPMAFLWRLPWALFLWSRCTEIGVAFLMDAYDKVDEPINHSALKPRDRLVLAFKSYGELILNFAILFALCPKSCWMAGASVPPSPGSLTDVLYFSATTITTSGNGAMIPTRGLLQFLSTYEIYCGLILLVVCFTIYTGLGKGRRPPGRRPGTDGPALPRR